MATTKSRHPAGSRYVERSRSTGLCEAVDVILDKGLVIDLDIGVSLLGIELLTIDGRIVIASIDTYLRFAEAVNRLDLADYGDAGLTQLVGDGARDDARTVQSAPRPPRARAGAARA